MLFVFTFFKRLPYNKQLINYKIKYMSKLSWLKRIIWLALAFFAVASFVIIITIIYLELHLPSVKRIKDVQLQVPLRVFTSNGQLIAEFGSKRRNPVTLQQIPKIVIDATLATEDQRYYYHSGVDLLGLGRAAVVLILTGKKEQGGSTITMQVARNYFLTRKKTFTRKIREILLAYRIDHTLSKNKVLELYFNKIFYGNRAYGIAAAAQVYYGKPLKNLTLAEAAMLAGLPQAPSYLNPIINPTAALKRRNHVLERMYEESYITAAQYQQALAEPLTAKYHGLKIGVNAPYIAELIRNEMVMKYGEKAYTTGLRVYTTINPKLQTYANIAIRNGVLAYDKRHGYRGPVENLGNTVPANLTVWEKALSKIPTINILQPAAIIAINADNSVTALLQSGQTITIPWANMAWARSQTLKGTDEYLGASPSQATDIVKTGDVIYTNFSKGSWQLSQKPKVEAALVAIDPQTGAILALVGGFDNNASSFNRVVQAYRQPGSSFKPFIYSAALAKGYTLASMLNDAPIVIPTNSLLGLWRPENDTHKFYGMTSLKTALIQSRNLVSIRLLQLIGIPYAINYVTRFGFNADQLPQELSLALGTANVTPLQMVIAYSVFANGGYKITPYLIEKIANRDNKIIYSGHTPTVCDSTCQQNLVQNNQGQTNSSTNFAPQVITSQNAFLMTQALKAVITGGTGKPALVLHREDLAGKTGTTNEKVDAWFSGYNNHLVVTTWMGFDQPKPLYEYGDQAALPVWINFMKLALKNQPLADLPEPPGIISVRINPATGKTAGSNDTTATFEYFIAGTVPQASSPSLPAANPNTPTNSEEGVY